ncbi:DinB family protein [Methylobacterium sp. JK268]
MSAQALLLTLFRYKESADAELIAAVSTLDAADRDVATALRILHHNHIIDRIFAANLQRRDHGYRTDWSEESPPVHRLAAEVAEINRWYVAYLSRATAEDLSESVDFRFSDGGHGRMSREEMLAHVVTHGGYHRGEVGRLLPTIGETKRRDVFAGYLHRVEPDRRAA